MTARQPPSDPGAPTSRRRFIGLAAAAVAIPAAAVTVDKLATSNGATPDKAQKSKAAVSRRPPAENSLPGDPHWKITHLGKPDAMLGYAGQASVMPGEEITLYASTAARSFQVHAFRMGWYGGDRARQLWSSASVRGHRQRPATLVQPTRTVETNWGQSLTIPTEGWPEGSYLLRMDSEAGAQRYVPDHRPLGQHGGQDRHQELHRDLAGLQHLGRPQPLQRARRRRRLRQPLAGCQPGPAV